MATLHDVAREAGVSLATASRVLNGSERVVGEKYRTKVMAVADRLGYRPNLPAQAIAKGTTRMVALVVADILDPFFSAVAAGVADAADAAGLLVTVSQTARDSRKELALVRELRGFRPRAILLVTSRLANDPVAPELAAELAAYTESGGAVTVFGRSDLDISTLGIAHHEGARDLTDTLVGLGYRRFAAVTGPHHLHTAGDRLAGWREGLAAHDLPLPAERITVTDFTRDGGYEATHRMVARGLDGTDVILAGNDVMAMGVLSALRDAGLEPGRDVGVAGFDDIPTVRDVTPTLTTVNLPLENLGRQALSLALAGESAVADTSAVRVIVRGSTPRR